MKKTKNEYERMFQALGDIHRLQIMELLLERERSAGELLDMVDIVQSTLSHHMKILCESGMVTARKSGRWTYYTISEPCVRAALDFLNHYLTKEAALDVSVKKYEPAWDDRAQQREQAQKKAVETGSKIKRKEKPGKEERTEKGEKPEKAEKPEKRKKDKKKDDKKRSKKKKDGKK